MEIYPLARGASDGGDGCEALIETVATPRFHAELLRFCHRVAGAVHLAAFSHAGEERPRIVLAVDRDGSGVALSAGTAFIGGSWSWDPVTRMGCGDDDLGRGVIVRMAEHELREIPGWQDCYRSARSSFRGPAVVERYSLVRYRSGRGIRIDLYRPRGGWPAGEAEMGSLAARAGALLALVARHALGTLPPQQISSRHAYEEIIRRIAPHLPRREVEVCAGIALGLSTEAIARTLGIGVNTVLTYRRRAYARLRISSHNELLRAVFSAFTMVGVEDDGPAPWQRRVDPAKPLWRN